MPQLDLVLDSPFASSPSGAGAGHASSTAFRPIHYLGSKLRVVDEILSAVDEVDPTRGAVLDLFAGSGTVAMALSASRVVLASDIQEYSKVICSALLSSRLPDLSIANDFILRYEAARPFRERLNGAIAPVVERENKAIQAALGGDLEPICEVLEHGSLLAVELRGGTAALQGMREPLTKTLARLKKSGLSGSAEATALRYFGGTYFSYSQAAELDALSHVVDMFEPERRDLLRAALLSTASDIVNTVGKQFAQPIRPRSKGGVPKRHLIAKIARDRAIATSPIFFKWLDRYAAVKSGGRPNVAIREDYLDALNRLDGSFSVVYADPPYTRDHYSRFYHVLETLALRDNPAIALSPGAQAGELSRGLYRDDRHQSPFCIKSKVEQAFENLFSGVASCGASLVLSYSPFDKDTEARPRLMSVDALVSLAKRWFAQVETRIIDGVSHSKLNHSRLNYEIPPEAEILLLCKSPKTVI